MSDLVHHAGAVEQARSTVAAQARRLRALADAAVAVPAGAFGGLDAAGLGEALAGFRAALGTDLGAGADRLAGLERALDATERSLHATEHRAATSFAPGR